MRKRTFALAISESNSTLSLVWKNMLPKEDEVCRNQINISNSKICLLGSKENIF